MEINKVIICGLGAIGLTYANKLKDVCDLKILANNERIEKYKNFPPELNGEKIGLNYILPEEKEEADLIIISTKASGLDSAIKYIKNFVGENTIIISLLNGISSEEKIAEVYGKEKVLYSYFIGHSAVRDGNSVTQDGVGKIVFNQATKQADSSAAKRVETFFKKAGIEYEMPKDIIYSLWLKFGINIYLNQSSAVMNLTMGDMKHNPHFKDFAKKLINETKQIAKASGIKNLENFESEALAALDLMCDEGKSSMLQDILAGRKTEVDIFAGEIIKRGEKLGIPTPYNQIIYDMIKINEYRFYSGKRRK